MKIEKSNCGYTVTASVPHIAVNITIKDVEVGKRFEYDLVDYQNGKCYQAVWDDTISDFGCPESFCNIPSQYKMVCEAMTKALNRNGIAITVPYGDWFNDWHLEYSDWNRAIEFDNYKCMVLLTLYNRRASGRYSWPFQNSQAYDYYITDLIKSVS